MIRLMITLFAVALLALGASEAFAHENFRVIGTLTRHANSTIDVKTREGRTASIRLDKQTEISRDKKKVDARELKAGQSLVIDAYGDTLDDLLALEIRIVPPIAAR
jgi:hypothetical protein